MLVLGINNDREYGQRTACPQYASHRIGQQKVVTAYKLIARDTVEEKILALQQKKRALVDAALAEKVRPKYDMLHKQPR